MAKRESTFDPEYPLLIDRVTSPMNVDKAPRVERHRCRLTPKFIFLDNGDKFSRQSGRRIVPASWRGHGTTYTVRVDLGTLRAAPEAKITNSQAVRWGLVTPKYIGAIEAAASAQAMDDSRWQKAGQEARRQLPKGF